MTAATKPKRIVGTNNSKQSALEGLREFEAKLQAATEEANTLGRQHRDAHTRLYGYMDNRGLLYERSHRMERAPDEYEPDGSPRQKDSAAGRIQAAIDSTPDPAPLEQKVEHARRLKRQAQEAVDAYFAENIDEVLGSLRPEGEVLAAGVNERLGECVTELGKYIGFIQHVSSLVAAAGHEPRTITGVDEAAALRRTLERTALPAPIREDA
jgi:hypothetical protein